MYKNNKKTYWELEKMNNVLMKDNINLNISNQSYKSKFLLINNAVVGLMAVAKDDLTRNILNDLYNKVKDE